MRIWCVPPQCLDNRRLFGQHSEVHIWFSVAEAYHQGKPRGWANGPQCIPWRDRRSAIVDYHDNIIVPELERRGGNHKSPVISELQLPFREQGFKFFRCVTWQQILRDCRHLFEKWENEVAVVKAYQEAGLKTRVIIPKGNNYQLTYKLLELAVSHVYKIDRFDEALLKAKTAELMNEKLLDPHKALRELTEYSEQARRLAAAARELLKTQRVDDVPLPMYTELPEAVPLDRRRAVLLLDMSDEELDRALAQAKARIERGTSDAEAATRYNRYLHAITEEIDLRSKEKDGTYNAADFFEEEEFNEDPEIEEEADELPTLEVKFGEDPELAEERFRAAILPEGEDPEQDSLPKSVVAGRGINFVSHPGDTPESDSL